MKQKFIVAASFVFGIWLIAEIPAVIASADPASPEQIELGTDLYQEFCERCHGEPAVGLAEFEGSRDDLVERLEGMTEEMPDFWGMFSDDEVSAIYAYMQASKHSE